MSDEGDEILKKRIIIKKNHIPKLTEKEFKFESSSEKPSRESCDGLHKNVHKTVNNNLSPNVNTTLNANLTTNFNANFNTNSNTLVYTDLNKNLNTNANTSIITNLSTNFPTHTFENTSTNMPQHSPVNLNSKFIQNVSPKLLQTTNLASPHLNNQPVNLPSSEFVPDRYLDSNIQSISHQFSNDLPHFFEADSNENIQYSGVNNLQNSNFQNCKPNFSEKSELHFHENAQIQLLENPKMSPINICPLEGLLKVDENLIKPPINNPPIPTNLHPNQFVRRKRKNIFLQIIEQNERNSLNTTPKRALNENKNSNSKDFHSKNTTNVKFNKASFPVQPVLSNVKISGNNYFPLFSDNRSDNVCITDPTQNQLKVNSAYFTNGNNNSNNTNKITHNFKNKINQHFDNTYNTNNNIHHSFDNTNNYTPNIPFTETYLNTNSYLNPNQPNLPAFTTPQFTSPLSTDQSPCSDFKSNADISSSTPTTYDQLFPSTGMLSNNDDTFLQNTEPFSDIWDRLELDDLEEEPFKKLLYEPMDVDESVDFATATDDKNIINEDTTCCDDNEFIFDHDKRQQNTINNQSHVSKHRFHEDRPNSLFIENNIRNHSKTVQSVSNEEISSISSNKPFNHDTCTHENSSTFTRNNGYFDCPFQKVNDLPVEKRFSNSVPKIPSNLEYSNKVINDGFNDNFKYSLDKCKGYFDGNMNRHNENETDFCVNVDFNNNDVNDYDACDDIINIFNNSEHNHIKHESTKYDNINNNSNTITENSNDADLVIEGKSWKKIYKNKSNKRTNNINNTITSNKNNASKNSNNLLSKGDKMYWNPSNENEDNDRYNDKNNGKNNVRNKDNFNDFLGGIYTNDNEIEEELNSFPLKEEESEYWNEKAGMSNTLLFNHILNDFTWEDGLKLESM